VKEDEEKEPNKTGEKERRIVYLGSWSCRELIKQGFRTGVVLHLFLFVTRQTVSLTFSSSSFFFAFRRVWTT
jgi:hypothetical protein